MAFQAEYVVLPPMSDSESDVDSDGGGHSDTSSAGTTAHKHEYRPLKENEFRLLVLNPGLPDEPIECFLEHYTVNRAKPYQALSYVWGGDSKDSSCFIKVDGRPFQVTKNLKDFLLAYRSNTQCPVLWIDAVCINQSDIPERNAQIRLMKRVYEAADTVVVWLGPEIEGSTKYAVAQILSLWRNFWVPRMEREGGSEEKALASIQIEDIRQVLGFKIEDGSYEIYDDCWKYVHKLLEKPWWSRIWVYQEATAPAKRGSVVRHGPYSLDFSKVLLANKVLRHVAFGPLSQRDNSLTRFQKWTGTTAVYMDVYSELRRDYQKTGTSHYLRMADLLPTLRNFASTNPRDKLYALIPISLDGAELFDVNYSLSVEEVYTQAAVKFIQEHRNLDILGHCAPPDESSSLKDRLPSWVPDWTSQCAPVHFFKRTLKVNQQPNVPDKVEKLYHASLDTPAVPAIDFPSGTLFCKGIRFDVVTHVSPSANTSYSSDGLPASWKQWLRSSTPFRFSSRAGSYADGRSSTEAALARTLIADCIRDGVDIGHRASSSSSSSSDLTSQIQNLNLCSSSSSTTTTAPHSQSQSQSPQEAYPIPSSEQQGILGPHPSTYRRKLILTRNSYLGLTSSHVRPGDFIVILRGGQVPFVMRKVEIERPLYSSYYVLVGEAYVHGIMDGEAWVWGGRGGDGLELEGGFEIR